VRQWRSLITRGQRVRAENQNIQWPHGSGVRGSPASQGITALNVKSGPSLIRGWPLAESGVGRKQDSVNLEVKKILLFRADGGGKSGRDDRRPQVIGRLDTFGMASYEELVVDVLGTERMESETWITPKIRAFLVIA
jgi:hypothetical protein